MTDRRRIAHDYCNIEIRTGSTCGGQSTTSQPSRSSRLLSSNPARELTTADENFTAADETPQQFSAPLTDRDIYRALQAGDFLAMFHRVLGSRVVPHASRACGAEEDRDLVADLTVISAASGSEEWLMTVLPASHSSMRSEDSDHERIP